MVGKVKDILAINTYAGLQAAFIEFEEALDERLAELDEALDTNIASTDSVDTHAHGAFVQSWRNRVSRYLYLATAFTSHAKSAGPNGAFVRGRDQQGMTDKLREQYIKSLAGPFEALQKMLEKKVESIDTYVNFIKKNLDNENRGDKSRQLAA